MAVGENRIIPQKHFKLFVEMLFQMFGQENSKSKPFRRPPEAILKHGVIYDHNYIKQSLNSEMKLLLIKKEI